MSEQESRASGSGKCSTHPFFMEQLSVYARQLMFLELRKSLECVGRLNLYRPEGETGPSNVSVAGEKSIFLAQPEPDTSKSSTFGYGERRIIFGCQPGMR